MTGFMNDIVLISVLNSGCGLHVHVVFVCGCGLCLSVPNSPIAVPPQFLHQTPPIRPVMGYTGHPPFPPPHMVMYTIEDIITCTLYTELYMYWRIS